MAFRNSISSILLLFIALYLSIQSCMNTELQMPDTMTNMIIDNSTGNLYFGGKNFLLKTNADLVTIVQNTTGPFMDNPECYPLPMACDKTRVPTDNYNKILLLHKSAKQLVTCGSVYFGVCELRDMNTLKEIPTMKSNIIASSQMSPATGLIGMGPLGNEAFYIATSWGKKVSEDLPRPALATRTLSMDGTPFELEANRGTESKLTFKNKDYKVDYIYSFSSGDFVYFLAVQESYKSFMDRKTNINAVKEYETKISHVCQKDESYITYTEFPLNCTSSNGTDYNIATSGFVAKPGAGLAKKLGITTSDDVLFVTFGKSQPGSKTPQQESVLCYYSVSEIEVYMKNNIEKCYEGGTPLGMPWYHDDKVDTSCQKETFLSTCQLRTSKNYPIGGSIRLVKKAILEENNLISLTAMPYEDNTAVFMGDASGNLVKVSET